MPEPVESVHLVKTTAQRSWRQRRYTAEYKVLLSSVTTDAYYAVFASALPQLSDAHPVDLLARVVGVDTQPDGTNRQLYHTTVTYETRLYEPPRGAGSPAMDDPAEDPLDDPVDIRVEHVEESTVATEDRDGDPIVNSARDWFDPPVERTRYRPVITIVRNEADSPAGNAQDYLGTVNSGSITIAGVTFAANEAQMIELSGQKCQRLDNEYYQVTYRILGCFAGETHAISLVDQGYNYLDGSTKASIVDSKGERVSEPQRLDGSGGKLAANAALADTVYLDFDVYPEADWSTLSLPAAD